MIVLFQVFVLLGLVTVQPLSNCSKVDIISTLMSANLVPDDPAPYPEPWVGLLDEYR